MSIYRYIDTHTGLYILYIHRYMYVYSAYTYMYTQWPLSFCLFRISSAVCISRRKPWWRILSPIILPAYLHL